MNHGAASTISLHTQTLKESTNMSSSSYQNDFEQHVVVGIATFLECIRKVDQTWVTSGGVHFHRATPSHHPFTESGFSMKYTIQLLGYLHFRKPPYLSQHPINIIPLLSHILSHSYPIFGRIFPNKNHAAARLGDPLRRTPACSWSSESRSTTPSPGAPRWPAKGIPWGRPHDQWEITIFHGQVHYKWSFSIAMLV